MNKRSTYQPARLYTAPDRMRMAAAGALVAAGPMVAWLILIATLGGHQ